MILGIKILCLVCPLRESRYLDIYNPSFVNIDLFNAACESCLGQSEYNKIHVQNFAPTHVHQNVTWVKLYQQTLNTDGPLVAVPGVGAGAGVELRGCGAHRVQHHRRAAAAR